MTRTRRTQMDRKTRALIQRMEKAEAKLRDARFVVENALWAFEHNYGDPGLSDSEAWWRFCNLLQTKLG